LKKFEDEHGEVKIEREAEVSHYYHLRQQIETLRSQLLGFITTPKNILPFLNPGRLIKVVNKEDDFGWVWFLKLGFYLPRSSVHLWVPIVAAKLENIFNFKHKFKRFTGHSVSLGA
jgi:hypothetical protein